MFFDCSSCLTLYAHLSAQRKKQCREYNCRVDWFDSLYSTVRYILNRRRSFKLAHLILFWKRSNLLMFILHISLMFCGWWRKRARELEMLSAAFSLFVAYPEQIAQLKIARGASIGHMANLLQFVLIHTDHSAKHFDRMRMFAFDFMCFFSCNLIFRKRRCLFCPWHA